MTIRKQLLKKYINNEYFYYNTIKSSINTDIIDNYINIDNYLINFMIVVLPEKLNMEDLLQ